MNQVNNLGAAFGVDVTVPGTGTQTVTTRQVLENSDVFYSTDGQLEMDNDYGLFLHADMANLWTTDSAMSRQADAGVAMQAIDEEVARQVADAFLQENGLARRMPSSTKWRPTSCPPERGRAMPLASAPLQP